MGLSTSLAAISPTAPEISNAAASGADLVGLLNAARSRTNELVQLLKAISSALPNGDANIAAIAVIVNQLS